MGLRAGWRFADSAIPVAIRHGWVSEGDRCRGCRSPLSRMGASGADASLGYAACAAGGAAASEVMSLAIRTRL
jgi:hypothetical protein